MLPGGKSSRPALPPKWNGPGHVRRITRAGLALVLAAGAAWADPPTPSDPRALELMQSLALHYLEGESGYLNAISISKQVVEVGGRKLQAHDSIYYLLTRESPVNYLHWLECDDVHIILEGGPVDYFIFHPDGQVEKKTLGRDLAAAQVLVVSIPAGCWKALRLHPTAGYALMANVLTPQWTKDRVKIGAGPEFLKAYAGHAPWATEPFLRELIGPNFKAP